MTPLIRTLLTEAAIRLGAVSPTARLDAEILLAHVLGWSRARLLAESQSPVAEPLGRRFEELVARRLNLEPVAYLTGVREFYGREFLVDRRVLVPRPETELLVERALAWATTRPPALRVADIGTGSGAIAVTLALELPLASVLAVDLSQEALAVAQANAARHAVAARIRLLHGDLLAPLSAEQPLDMLVSNPPYTVLDAIEEGVRRHEPRLALDGGSQGLDVYQRLLAQAPQYLRPGGLLLLELGHGQEAAVGALARAAFPGALVQTYPDLQGIPRLLEVQAVHL